MTDAAHRAPHGGRRPRPVHPGPQDRHSRRPDRARRASPTRTSANEFRQVCRMLGAIYHYEYFDQLERLRDDYYYFNPEIDPHAGIDRGPCSSAPTTSCSRPSSTVLKGANFVEMSHAEIEHAHRRRVGAAGRGQGAARRLPRGALLPARPSQGDGRDRRLVRPAQAPGRDRRLRRRRAVRGDEAAGEIVSPARRDKRHGPPQAAARLGADQVFPQHRQHRPQRAVPERARGA